MDILCVMGKSCSGKSYYIKQLCESDKEKYYYVRSRTTRAVRESDKDDIYSHKFVTNEQFDNEKHIMLLYKSPKGYYNYTTEEDFIDGKINVYAIDPVAFMDMIDRYGDKWNIRGIYMNTDEDVRRERCIRRNENYSEEPQLDYGLIKDEYRKFVELKY